MVFHFACCCTQPEIGGVDQVVSAAPPVPHPPRPKLDEDPEEQLFDDPEDTGDEEQNAIACPAEERRVSCVSCSAGGGSTSSTGLLSEGDDKEMSSWTCCLENGNIPHYASVSSSESCSSTLSPPGAVVEEGLSPAAFAGQWKLERVEGDVDAFMASCGTPWAVRKMAKALKYGVGSSEQKVSVVNNQLTIVNKIGLKESTSYLCLDGQESETNGLDGKLCVTSADREKDGVVIRTRRRTGTCLGVVRRYFDAGTLVVEATSPGGHTVRRFYARL